MKGLRWKKQQYSSLGGAYGIRQRYMTVFISDRNDKAVFFCFYNTEKRSFRFRLLYWNWSKAWQKGKS